MQCKSFSHFFNKKFWHFSDISVRNFKETLTNDVVSFEQPGPECFVIIGDSILKGLCHPGKQNRKSQIVNMVKENKAEPIHLKVLWLLLTPIIFIPYCSWGPDDDGRTVDGPHVLASVSSFSFSSFRAPDKCCFFFFFCRTCFSRV